MMDCVLAQDELYCCLWCLLQVFDLLMGGSELVSKLQENTRYFRSVLEGAGFTVKVSGVPPPN